MNPRSQFKITILFLLICSITQCKSYSFYHWSTSNNLCDNKINPEPLITLESLVHLDKQKCLISLISRYCNDPESFDRGQLKIAQGYFLTSPSSLRHDTLCLSNALVNELNKIMIQQKQKCVFGFYVVHPESLFKMGTAEFIKEARRHAPCVIYIHDVDELQYEHRGGNKEIFGELIAFMGSRIECRHENKIILLASTNRPENLMTGKLISIIGFDYPNFNERKSLFNYELKNFLPDIEQFDLDKLAEKSDGLVWRDIIEVINAAMDKKQNRPPSPLLTQKDLEDQLQGDHYCISDNTEENI